MVQIIEENLMPLHAAYPAFPSVPKQKNNFLADLGLSIVKGISGAVSGYEEIAKERKIEKEKQQKRAQEIAESQKVDQYLNKLGIKDTAGLPMKFKESLLKQHFDQENVAAKEKEPKEITPDKTTSILKNMGISERNLDQLGSENRVGIWRRANEFKQKGFSETEAVLEAYNELVNPEPLTPTPQAAPSFTPQAGQVKPVGQNPAPKQSVTPIELEEQAYAPDVVKAYQNGQISKEDALRRLFGEEKEKHLPEAVEKGGMASSLGRAKAIEQGIPYSQYEKQIELENPGFVNRFVKGVTSFGADFPLYTAGGAAGGAVGSAAGPIGTAVGGGAGAMALPQVVDTVLREYHKYKEQGGDKPLDEFIKETAKLAAVEGGKAGIEGAAFGLAAKSLPIIKKIPGLEALFEKPYIGKAAQLATKAGAETAAVTATKSALNQEMPTAEGIIDTFAQVVGFNVLGILTDKAKTESIKQIEKSGMPPEKVAAELKERMEKGEVKSVEDVENVIKDITSTHKGPEKAVASQIMETLKKVKTPEPREIAENLAERPVEETIKSEKEAQEKYAKPLTEKEKAKRTQAQNDADKVQAEIDKRKEEINFIEENKKMPKAKREKALELKQSEIADLEKKHKKLEAIAEKGREPFEKESLKEPIEKHMELLEEAATDPMGTTAKEWREMFDADQAYVDEYAKRLKMGELPPIEKKNRIIDILETYQETYRNTMKELTDGIKTRQEAYDKSNKRTAESRKLKGEIDVMQRHLNMLTRNLKINESKIGLQKDKLQQLYQLKKPGSAITKQILKDLRKDIVDIQKEYIKQKTEMDAFDAKVNKLSKEQIKETADIFKEMGKGDKKAAIERLAKQYNVKPEVIEQTRVEGRKEAEKIMKSEGDNKAVERKIDQFMKMLTYKAKNVPRQVAWAIGTELLIDFIEEQTGYRPNYSWIHFFTTGAGSMAGSKNLIRSAVSSLKEGGARTAIAHLFKHLREVYKLKNKKNEYQKLKTFKEKFAFEKMLREEKYTNKEIDEILGLSAA